MTDVTFGIFDETTPGQPGLIVRERANVVRALSHRLWALNVPEGRDLLDELADRLEAEADDLDDSAHRCRLCGRKSKSRSKRDRRRGPAGPPGPPGPTGAMGATGATGSPGVAS